MASNNDNKTVDEALTQAVSKLSDILATAADGGGQRKYLDLDGLAELVDKLNATLVASGDVRVVKALTEDEYDALATKEPNVLYVITE